MNVIQMIDPATDCAFALNPATKMVAFNWRRPEALIDYGEDYEAIYTQRGIDLAQDGNVTTYKPNTWYSLYENEWLRKTFGRMHMNASAAYPFVMFA